MTTFEYRGHQVAISEAFDMGWCRIYIDAEYVGRRWGKEAESTARQLVDVMKQMGFEYKGHQVSLGRYIVNGHYVGWFARIDEVATRSDRTLNGIIAVTEAFIDGHPRLKFVRWILVLLFWLLTVVVARPFFTWEVTWLIQFGLTSCLGPVFIANVLFIFVLFAVSGRFIGVRYFSSKK